MASVIFSMTPLTPFFAAPASPSIPFFAASAAPSPTGIFLIAPKSGYSCAKACEAEATAAAIPTAAVMNSRRCMISSFEVRTYSTTTLGTAQGCQLYGPNQESKARSDYVIAQPSMLHASRRPVSLRCDGRGHREWPCFHGVKLNLPQLGGHGPRPYASSPHRCRAEAHA